MNAYRKVTPSLEWNTLMNAVSIFVSRQPCSLMNLYVDCGDNLVAGAVIATDNGCNMGCAGKATYVALVG